MDTADLIAAVAREFDDTGAGTPQWSDPHEGMDRPRDEEYSRCLDPAKYRIVAARAEAWARALEATGQVARGPVDDPGAVWNFASLGDEVRHPPAERGEWLRPRAEHAIPLLMTLRAVDATDNHLDIGAGDPAVRLASVPYCGCDACDSGSDDLLTLIDETVLVVVAGELVHVTTDNGTIQTTWSGTSASGNHGGSECVDAILREARAGRSPHGVVSGAAWW